MNWKFSNATNRIVYQIFPDGHIESCTVEAIADWIAAGNTPTPADPPPPLTQNELDAIAANAYAKLTALKGMTPAQVDAWVTANVVDLATAKDAIKTLAIGVSILARRI